MHSTWLQITPLRSVDALAEVTCVSREGVSPLGPPARRCGTPLTQFGTWQDKPGTPSIRSKAGEGRVGFRAAHTCAKMATSGARDKFTPTHPPKDAVCDHHTAALCSFQKEVFLEAQRDKKESPLCHTDGHMSRQKMLSWNPNYRSIKSEVVLRGHIVKDDSGAYAVFTEQGSSASQMTAAKIMDVIERLPDCDGQSADPVSACTRVKLEDAPRIPDVWIHLTTNMPQNMEKIEDPVITLERNLYGYHGKDNSKKLYLNLDGRKCRIGNVRSFIVHKAYFCQFLWMTSKWLERRRTCLPCGRNIWNMWILTKPHDFLIMCTWDALSVNVNRMKQLLDNMRRCLNHVFLLVQQKNYRDGKNLTHKPWRGLTTWNCQIKESGAIVQSFKSLLGWSSIQAIGTRINWRVVRRLLTNCLEMLVLGELDDLAFYAQSTSLRDQSQSGLRHVTDAGQGWFLTFFTQTISDSVVMWETRHSTHPWGRRASA